MLPTVKHRSLPALDLSSSDAGVILATAGMLQRAAQAGATQPLLRGKNLGLVCEARYDADAALFRGAAVALGAHVAHIPASLSELSSAQEVKHTARMLGRLYDAEECQGMAAALVRRISDEAGVPIYDGIASPRHPTARLAEQLEGDASAADKRSFVLQAVLLGTLA
jgi:ornithine carbamoyltransferase